MAQILIISAISPYPADNGKKVVVSGILEYLKSRYGSKNVRYLFLGKELPSDQLNTSYDFLPIPKGLRKISNIIYYSFVKRKKSLQESIFYSATLQAKIHRYINEYNPDLIIFDTVRIGQFGFPPGFRNRSILYMEDLFSVRYEKMLKNSFDNNKQQINALGNFAQHVPSLLRNTVMKLSFLERMLLNFEKTLVWKSERTIPEEFTKCLLLNDEEAQYLAEYTTANVKVMRPNIHVPGSSSSREYNGNKTYVFLGVLNLPYNETGLIEFIEKSLPILIEKSPASKLRIIGRNPTQRIINVVKKYPHNIVLEGYVEDLSEALHSCCAMIVPLLFGSGIKIKVLEAIAHGVPIVTTSVGAMSIPLEHKFHCFIEDNLHSFPDWLIMLQDIKTNKSISDNSLLLYKSLFSKDAITESYDKLFSLNSSEQVHQ